MARIEVFRLQSPNLTVVVKNLSSYCGLVDAKIRAFDKDLPVAQPCQDLWRLQTFFQPLLWTTVMNHDLSHDHDFSNIK